MRQFRGALGNVDTNCQSVGIASIERNESQIGRLACDPELGFGTNNCVAKCLRKGPRLWRFVLIVPGSDNLHSGAQRWPSLTLFCGPKPRQFRVTGLLFLRYSWPRPFHCGRRFIYRALPRPCFFAPFWSALGLLEVGQAWLPLLSPHSLSTIISYLRSTRWVLNQVKFLVLQSLYWQLCLSNR
jgi:hypothetical protein